MGRHQVLRRKDWRDDSVLKSTCQSCGGPSLVAQHQQGSSQSFSIPTIGDPTPSSGLRWQRMHLVYYIQAKRKTKINLIKKIQIESPPQQVWRAGDGWRSQTWNGGDGGAANPESLCILQGDSHLFLLDDAYKRNIEGSVSRWRQNGLSFICKRLRR